jgi:FMN phosphatase YigB (HAD superfamily)
MKLILDFDDTIFDTGSWMEEIINIFIGEGFTREEYFVNYERSKKEKGDFDIDSMIGFFGEKKGIDKKKIKSKIDALIKNSKKFVYEDFFDFVRGFEKKDLILVSVGLKEIQMGKIENSGIVPFLSRVSIPKKYKSDEIDLVSKKYPSEKIFFIDDKAKQIDEAKRRLPQIVAIKMERPTGRHVALKSELADFTVKNLSEAKEIINR